MIIKIQQPTSSPSSSYDFGQQQNIIVLGRNPSAKNSITIDQQTVSRNHLEIKFDIDHIYIKDLGSRNGTKVNNNLISPHQQIQVTQKDSILIASFQGSIILQRKNNGELKNTYKKKELLLNDRQSNQNFSRSREKKKKFLSLSTSQTLKLSQSTLSMLRQMKNQKKTKDQRIKFLKLMGYKNVEQEWISIERLLEKNPSEKFRKKTNLDLEKQFLHSRTNMEKKGLGNI